jgi:ribosomal protein L37AE/L43A
MVRHIQHRLVVLPPPPIPWWLVVCRGVAWVRYVWYAMCMARTRRPTLEKGKTMNPCQRCGDVQKLDAMYAGFWICNGCFENYMAESK